MLHSWQGRSQERGRPQEWRLLGEVQEGVLPSTQTSPAAEAPPPSALPEHGMSAPEALPV